MFLYYFGTNGTPYCNGYNSTDFSKRLSGVVFNGLGNSHSEVGPVAMFPGEREGDVYVGTATVTSSQYQH